MLEEKKNINKRNDGEIVSLNDLVPKFHLLRKIDKSIDWKKIYPIVEGKYSNMYCRRTTCVMNIRTMASVLTAFEML